MILGFKTQIKGKPTHFVEKILALKIEAYKKLYTPKIHTIRNGNRWAKGKTIQMATGVRTKNYCQFNKNIDGLDVCKNVQSIKILRVDDLPKSLYNNSVYVIDIYCKSLKETFQMAFKVHVGVRFLNVEEIIKLAVNDGFTNPEEMFNWFDNQNFAGQLIHWTDFTY